MKLTAEKAGRFGLGLLMAVGMLLFFANIVNPDGICSFGDGWGMRDCSETSGSPARFEIDPDVLEAIQDGSIVDDIAPSEPPSE